MKIKFRNPPVTEVVIGVYFSAPIFQLRAEHVGLFWNSLRKKFPQIQPQPELPMPQPPIPVFSVSEGYPMPRYWLVSADGSTILQIQRNAFLLNWKKTDQEYPHFENVKDSFDRYFAIFKSFLASELGVISVDVQLADVNYINVITPCAYWSSLDDTVKVIPSFSFPYTLGRSIGQQDFQQIAMEQMSHEVSLTTTIRSARLASDASKPVLVIELRAVGPVDSADPTSLGAWLEQAHERIVSSFMILTDPHIQQSYWVPM
jgi:uncharacterized protein (TIGR04255 family)